MAGKKLGRFQSSIFVSGEQLVWGGERSTCVETLGVTIYTFCSFLQGASMHIFFFGGGEQLSLFQFHYE